MIVRVVDAETDRHGVDEGMIGIWRMTFEVSADFEHEFISADRHVPFRQKGRIRAAILIGRHLHELGAALPVQAKKCDRHARSGTTPRRIKNVGG